MPLEVLRPFCIDLCWSAWPNLSHSSSSLANFSKSLSISPLNFLMFLIVGHVSLCLPYWVRSFEFRLNVKLYVLPEGNFPALSHHHISFSLSPLNFVQIQETRKWKPMSKATYLSCLRDQAAPNHAHSQHLIFVHKFHCEAIAAVRERKSRFRFIRFITFYWLVSRCISGFWLRSIFSSTCSQNLHSIRAER